MKTIYGRQFGMMAGVVLLSFLLLGSSFSTLSYQYVIAERRTALERTANNVAALTATALTDYNDRGLTSPFIQSNLTYLAVIADSGIILTTPEGAVALAVNNDGTISSELLGESLPAFTVQAAQSKVGYTGMTDLGGLYESKRYVVGMPITLSVLSGGQSVSYVAGIVFLSSETSNLIAMWRDMSSIFLLSAGVVILLAVLISSFTSMRQSQPLKEIANAAREFGHGNLKVRVDAGGRQDEIGELAEAFNAMAESLSKSEERRSEFIANVSHELKTPMTTIAGFADGILDGTIPPEREREYLQVISSETRRLSRLVRNMLDISRVRSSEAGDAQAQFDICEVLLRVLVSLENKINAKHLEVLTELPEEPLPVWGDPDSITQVCYNLLDNAIKFSREGGNLMLEIKSKGAKAFVTVGDEGETIPAEEIPLIFDRFHKSDRSRSMDRDGVGLGLYIVKTILNSHKENIICTSEDGVTKFTFTLTKA